MATIYCLYFLVFRVTLTAKDVYYIFWNLYHKIRTEKNQDVVYFLMFLILLQPNVHLASFQKQDLRLASLAPTTSTSRWVDRLCV